MFIYKQYFHIDDRWRLCYCPLGKEYLIPILALIMKSDIYTHSPMSISARVLSFLTKCSTTDPVYPDLSKCSKFEDLSSLEEVLSWTVCYVWWRKWPAPWPKSKYDSLRSPESYNPFEDMDPSKPSFQHQQHPWNLAYK